MLWRLGTTGYHFPGWAGTFYPEGLPRAKWLGYYAGRFGATELNNTFHTPPTAEKIRRWGAQVPEGFRFAVKAPRAVTHDLPASEAVPLFAAFCEEVRAFGPHLGPVLLQFPPDYAVERTADLARLLTAMPTDVRAAVEFRHPSWFREETFVVLRDHAACLVAAELDRHPESATLTPTTDFLYVRLIGRHGRFPDESRERFDPTPRLTEWHTRLLAAAETEAGRGNPPRECWVMVNNDYAGHSPATVRRFGELAGLAGPEKVAKQGRLFDL